MAYEMVLLENRTGVACVILQRVAPMGITPWILLRN